MRTKAIILAVLMATWSFASAAGSDLTTKVQDARTAISDELGGPTPGRTAKKLLKAQSLLGAWDDSATKPVLRQLARAVGLMEKSGVASPAFAQATNGLVAGLGSLADERDGRLATALQTATGKPRSKALRLATKARNIRQGAPSSAGKAAKVMVKALAKYAKALKVLSSGGGGTFITTEGQTWRNVVQVGDRFVEEADPAAQQRHLEHMWTTLSTPRQWVSGSFYWWFNMCELYPGDGQRPCFTYGGYDVMSGYVLVYKVGAYYLANGSGPFYAASVQTWDTGFEFLVINDSTHFAMAKPTPAGNAMMVTVYEAQ